MLRTHYFQCPDCSQIFGFQQHLTTEEPPNFCPICGSSMTEPPLSVFVPQAPHVARTIGRTADQVYRQHEQASADHAEMMAQMAGGSASDYPKLTNMADSLREGDVAAKKVSNPVSKAMEQQQAGGFQPLLGRSGADYAANTVQGAFPRSGEMARRDLARDHLARARVFEQAGQLSRYKT